MKQITAKAVSCAATLALVLTLCGFTAAGAANTVPEARLINTQTFSASNLSALQAHYAADNLILLESENSSILLKEYCSYSDPSYRATATTAEGILKIQGGKRPQNTSYRSYIELYLPPSFSGAIQLNTASGKVQSTGTTFSGPVSITTASGKIQLTNIAFALDCQTASGAIQVEGSSLRGRLNTASGRITAQTDRLGGDLDIMSAAGKIEVTLSPTASFKLSASTASGTITNAFSGTSASKNQSTSHGANPAHTITIQGASSNINIQRAADSTH